MNDVLSRIVVASLAVVSANGCSFMTTRSGTDAQFFRELDAEKDIGTLAASPMAFRREMTSRGASCFDAVEGVESSRTVCGYAICSNFYSFVTLWEYDRVTSKASQLKSTSGGKCVRAEDAELEKIQKSVVRQTILDSGQQVH